MAETSPGHQSSGQPAPAQRPVRWPLWIALFVIALVWAGGCAWSFEEQTAFAQSKQFHLPQLLPLVIDGFAVAMAAVAWAASLDGRAAVFARFGTAIAVACSSASNAAWAWERSGADPLTVALGAGIPLVTNVAFEVLLSETRKQVNRLRGVPAPQAIPFPRLITIGLSPVRTPLKWRRLVLELTDPARQFAELLQQANRPERTAPPVRTSPPAADRSGGNVTPISRVQRRTRTVQHRTATGGQPGPAALRDAKTVVDRYDYVPGRNELMRDFGWGADRARNALKALPEVQSSRPQNHRVDDQPPADDDKERDHDPALVTTA